jgi:glucokinase
MNTILTADIGGTNSRFACFRADEKDKLQLVEVTWLKTGESSET